MSETIVNDVVGIPERASETPEMGVYRVAWLLWSNRRFLWRMAAVGVAAGILLTLLIPARYTATAQLMPPDTVSSSMGMAAIAAGMTDKAGGLGTAAADLLGFKSSGALFVAILKSRTVQDRMVERFELQKIYKCRYRMDARRRLSDRTEISEDRKSGVIKVDVIDRSPERAQQMAKAYVEELNRVVSTSAMSAAARERGFIEERMAEVKKEMDDSAQALATFSSKSNTIDIKEQAKAMMDAVAGVQGQLIAAQTELRGLQSIYTNENYRVRAAQAQVAELNRQLKVLDGDAAVKTANMSDYPTIRQLPVLGVTFEDLYRRNKIADAVYEALVQQYEMSKIEEAKDTPKVQMLDVPETPEVKSFPPRSLIVVGSLLFSLVFASGWIISAEQWRSTDKQNPGKCLIYVVADTIKGHPLWKTRQVAAITARVASFYQRFSLHSRTQNSNPAGAD